jgi:hypothetical protein
LVATLGVAAVSYVGCETSMTSGNLVPPPPQDSGGTDAKDGSVLDVVANLVAPPDSTVPDVRGPRDGSFRDVVANLVAPDLGAE